MDRTVSHALTSFELNEVIEIIKSVPLLLMLLKYWNPSAAFELRVCVEWKKSQHSQIVTSFVESKY